MTIRLLTLGIAACLALTGCDLLFGTGEDPLGLDDDDDNGSSSRFAALDATCDSLALAGDGDPAATDEQLEMAERLNCYRQVAGITEAELHPILSQAAQSHADYAAANDEFSHGESNTEHEHYTGNTARDRIIAAGWPYDSFVETVAEVMTRQQGGASPTRAVDKWMESVYHRAPLMIPELTAIGAGAAGTFDVMNTVSPWAAAEARFARYPAAGQEDVTTAWDSDWEIPDPAPDQGDIGLPVTLSTISGPAGGGLIVESTSLTGPDGAVPFRQLDPANDGLLMRTVALVPTEVYAAGATYDVHITGTLDGVAFDEAWSFTTAD